MTERNVIVHYHLFKNAGSSVDQLLRTYFKEKWMPFDGNSSGDIITTEQLEETIKRAVDKVAFSSHQIVPPLPNLNCNVFPIVFLRDPIDRVRSAYLFEWQKQLGLEQPKDSFKNFVLEKFARKRISSVEDFQTMRLSNSHRRDFRSRQEPDETLLANAKEFISSLSFIGIVDEFNRSMELMQPYLNKAFPDFQISFVKANVLQDTETPLHLKHEKIREELGEEIFRMVVERNSLDQQLYEFAKKKFEHLIGNESYALAKVS